MGRSKVDPDVGVAAYNVDTTTLSTKLLLLLLLLLVLLLDLVTVV